MVSDVQTMWSKTLDKSAGEVILEFGKTIYKSFRFRSYRFLEAELDSNQYFDVSPSQQLWLYKRGFLSQSDTLYDFRSYDYRDYLTDYQRLVKTRHINGAFRHTVINKYDFHHALRAFDEHRPTVYALIKDGRVYPEYNNVNGRAMLPPSSLPDKLDDVGKMVFKPVRSSGGGKGVCVAMKEGADRFVVDGEAMDRHEFENWISSLETYLATEFVEQASYADKLYPNASNTIRLVTMVDDDGPFLGAAYHRIGTTASAPVDNWSSGGLSTEIDADGTLSKATRFPYGGTLEWFDTHPDTGSQIEGIVVPDWDDISDSIVRIAADLSHIPYIGWDVLVTDNGFKILEGNAHVDVDLMQVHGPLLTDDRVRQFYDHHNVI